MEWIFILIAMLVLFSIGRYFRKKYLNTKPGLLIFFLVFILLIVTFSIDMVKHFTYVKLFLVSFLFITGGFNYYEKFLKINNKQSK